MVLPAGTTEDRRRLAAICELAGIDVVGVHDDGEVAEVATGLRRLGVVVRPTVERRPGVGLLKQPASAERVHLKFDKAKVAEFAAAHRAIAPDKR